MRMWNVNPSQMCLQHLLGEHVECHMMVGNILKGNSIKGFIDKGLIEVHNIKRRHNLLAKEMLNRGINHKSKLIKFRSWKEGNINIKTNIQTLKARCNNCFKEKTNETNQYPTKVTIRSKSRRKTN